MVLFAAVVGCVVGGVAASRRTLRALRSSQ